MSRDELRVDGKKRKEGKEQKKVNLQHLSLVARIMPLGYNRSPKGQANSESFQC